jgi:diguanylate cyclase (GGDEF)-like protein
MSKPTAHLNQATPAPAGPAAVRLVATVAVAGLAAVAIGVGAIAASAALAAGSSMSSVALIAVGLLAVTLLCVSLRLQKARSELDRRRAEIQDMASLDPLTGICNRNAFQRELDRHFRPGASLVLMLIDIDNLKSVNDSLGHSVGDAVLRGTASRIQACLRSTDVVSRLAGDEFAVLLPRVDPAVVEIIARRIVEASQRPYPADLHNCTVSASAGVVVMNGELSTTELLRNADVALTAAKRDGKGQHVMYRSEMHGSQVARITFERDLRTALDQDQFVVHYQPMVDSKSRRILGVEALVRWNHPERGLVPPLDFLPMAEATGLIIPLGAWVLREACRQAQVWRSHNPGVFDDFVVSVNVSARQLFGTQLEDDVVAALNESGLDPRHLVLEIIESQVMTDLHAALKQLAALKELGVRIAIDDFGSGYSSLGHLQELPVDFLKLDKSFTDNIAESVKSQELMRTVAQLSRNLAIVTVAEGVETLEQADVLHALDVNVCQGYFFARPVDARSIAQLLERASHLPEEAPHHGTAPAARGGRLSVPVPRPVRVASPPN